MNIQKNGIWVDKYMRREERLNSTETRIILRYSLHGLNQSRNAGKFGHRYGAGQAGPVTPWVNS